MFDRKIEEYIQSIRGRYQAITLLGPRQSGKSTLAKKLFSDFEYCSLEELDIREIAQKDPRAFFSKRLGNTIIDEIQRVPDLLSYLQGILDDKKDQRQWILTGSNSLLLSEKITQSLAGRTRILQVLPLSYHEIPKEQRSLDIDQILFCGGYPRIYDEKLRPEEWLSDYIQSYVEKDVRSMLQISNLNQFQKYIQVLASRAGQLMNYSSFQSDVGITHSTAASWLSVLESSYIVFKLAPHFKNFSKRITKSPKVYFWDTGVLCHLLKIRNTEQLERHPLRGHIFENWVVSELHKNYLWVGRQAPLYFWRDQSGHEIDIVIDCSTHLFPIEIKSSQTFHTHFTKTIEWFNKLQNNENKSGLVIYGGNAQTSFSDSEVYPWNSDFNLILKED